MWTDSVDRMVKKTTVTWYLAIKKCQEILRNVSFKQSSLLNTWPFFLFFQEGLCVGWFLGFFFGFWF